MTQYLVTGGAGFIGSNLVAELVNQHHHVRVIDNLSTGDKLNLQKYLTDIEFIKGDIRDLKFVKKWTKNIDYIVHLAAARSVLFSIINPLETNEINVTGTLNLLSCAVEHKVKKFIFASSSSIYGNNTMKFNRESDLPNPLSPYAVSKLTGEKYCQIYQLIYHLPTVSLRLFNVFGPNQSSQSAYAAVIPIFMHNLANNQNSQIYGDGTQSRDFTYITNVTAAILGVIKSKHTKGQVYNIACGENYSINQLYNYLTKIMGKPAKAKYLKKRAGDIFRSQADIKQAEETFGYQPKIKFYQGLKLTLDWYNNLKNESN